MGSQLVGTFLRISPTGTKPANMHSDVGIDGFCAKNSDLCMNVKQGSASKKMVKTGSLAESYRANVLKTRRAID